MKSIISLVELSACFCDCITRVAVKKKQISLVISLSSGYSVLNNSDGTFVGGAHHLSQLAIMCTTDRRLLLFNLALKRHFLLVYFF